MKKIKEWSKAKKIISSAILLIALCVGGFGIYSYSSGADKAQVETKKVETKAPEKASKDKEKEDKLKASVKGLENLIIQEKVTLDLDSRIKADSKLVKEVKVDDSKVDYTKAGKYTVTYTIVPTDKTMKNIVITKSIQVVTEAEAKKLSASGKDVITKSDVIADDAKEAKKEDTKEETKKEEAKKEETKKEESKKDTSSSTSDKASNSSSSNGGKTSNNSSSSGSKPAKEKVWVEPVYKAVHHAEVGHHETQTVVEGYMNTEITGEHVACYCGATFNTTNEWGAHSEAAGRQSGCGGYRVVPTYSEVWVAPITQQVWVVDKPAWTEQVLVSEGYWK